MPCPYCGAKVPDTYEECQALMHEVSSQSYSGNTSTFRLYRAAFDAYTLQHPEIYCVSAKSYAAHLGGLACWAEYGSENEVYAAIQRWLNGNVDLEKPFVPPPMKRGKLTVLDIYEHVGTLEYPHRVAAWCSDVWQAYTELHSIAHDYVQIALGEK
jgi:hypothetical protein